MHAVTSLDCSRIAQDLQIRKVQVENVAQLLEEGHTVPFIARYRKERSGGLSEEALRQILQRLQFLRRLADRKQTILKSIDHQGRLTEDLRQAILSADTTKHLEDLFLPYKPKKASAAANAARERGLTPLAQAIWHGDPAAANLEELLPGLVQPDKQLAAPEDVRAGLGHLLAEWMAEIPNLRAAVRALLWETGQVTSTKSEKVPEGQALEYKEYFQFSDSARQIHAHRVLVMNRGDKAGALKIKLDYDQAQVRARALHALAEHLLTVFGKVPESAPPPASVPAAPPTDPAPPAVSSPEPSAVPAEVAESAPAQESSAQPAEEPAPPPPAQENPPAAEAPQTEAPVPPAPTLGLPVAPRNDWSMAGETLAEGVDYRTPHAALLRTVLDDALQRLVLPNLEREIRGELTDEAEAHAVHIFARNLRSLLMQPPLRNCRVLAIDPNLRGGSKVVVLDEYGNLLDHLAIYPFGGRKNRDRGAAKANGAAPAAAPATESAPATAGTGAATPATETAAAETAMSETPASENPAEDIAAPAGASPAPVDAAAAEAPSADSMVFPGAEAPEAAPATAGEPAAEPSAAEPAATDTPAPPVTAESSTPPVPEEPATPPPDKKAEARAKLHDLITRHEIKVIALGNGPGCREMEEIVADTIADLSDVSYALVNEAGSSAYAGSPAGREEFPDLDAAARSAVSIGRRLQDPLSELVKIDPIHLGAGLSPFEIARKDLKETLEGVVESCVNQVGVDVNTASVAFLRYVSGLNPLVARELVEFRKNNGPFPTRESLLMAPSLAPRFVQAAGFLKIHGGPNPLDRTWVHPESYPVAEKILAGLGFSPATVDDPVQREELRNRLNSIALEPFARELGVGVPTVDDIFDSLANPDRDARSEGAPAVLKKGLRKLEDLQPGLELKGTVLNVVDFGAFVDVGLKDSGLVHISQMANRYIKSPYDVVAVNDVVQVWVLSVDKERGRVSLSMIKPGTERRAQERRPEGPRPPRGRRPEPGEGAPGGEERRPPRRGRQDRRGPPGQRSGPPQHGEGAAGDAGRPPPPRPPLPPRKPRREPPKPKLSQAALEGKVPLRTFGELSALFAAKTEKPQETKPPSLETPAPNAGPESPPAAASPANEPAPLPPPDNPPPGS